MKKILFINVTYKTGSTGRIIESIMSDKRAENFDYKVLFQQGDNADEHAYCFENKIENIFRRLACKVFNRQEWATVTETQKLIRKIKEYNPDIIHLNILHHQCTSYTMLFDFLKEYKKPVVITAHDCWIYTGGCYHYTEFGCDKFKTGCVGCTRERERLECDNSKTAEKLKVKCDFYNSCDFVYLVGVSNWICNEMKASQITNKNIIRIYNGIDIETFRPLKDECGKMKEKLIKGRKHLLVGVANVWGEGKGLSHFTALAKELGEDYQIVLVGGYLPSESPCDNLTYYGKTLDSNELAQIYSAADLFVNMSIEESFGLVSAEAAACGTKVIGFDSTANTEVIDLVNGIHIDAYDYESMKEKIIEFFENGQDNDSTIYECRQALSREKMTEEYWNLYNKILSDGEN